MTDMARLYVLNATRRLVLLVPAIGLAAGSAAPASTLTVPYTETFATGDANWKIGNNTAPSWVESGGPGDSSYISQLLLVSGGAFSGPTIFRGEESFGFSNDKFVGDWLAKGVGSFSVAVRHSAQAPIQFQVRFAPVTSNSPGASTVNHEVPSGAGWTTITVPIQDSASVFQAYSQVTPPNAEVFGDIFSNLGRIQIGLAAMNQQAAGINGGTFTFDLAAPSIAPVPEPGTWAALAAAATAAFVVRLRRLRGRHAA